MPNYIFNDTVLTQDDIEEIASIKGYTLEELFEKNPDIKETDPDEEGKEAPSQETVDAAVKVSDTASNLENGSSELFTKDISIDLEDPKKRKELGFTYGEEQKYLRNKDVPARLAEQATPPSILKSLLSQTARGFVRTAKGFEDFNNMVALNLASLDNPELTAEDKEQMKAFLDRGGLKDILSGISPVMTTPSSNNYKKVMETLSEGVKKFEDESITKAIEAGNYGAAAELAVGGALESLPSLLAAATGYGGLAMLGTSVAGNKFSEEFDANPEEALGTLTLNATGTGITEAAFELFTRGLLKKAGVIKTKTGVEAAKKFIKEGMETWLKRTGLKAGRAAKGVIGEAVSEGATEAVNIINDNLILDKELDLNSAEAWYQIGDGAIIGALMGGGVTSLGQLGNSSSAMRNRAETILAPIDVKRKYESAAIELSELAFDLNKTESAEGKKIILDQINTIETDITIAKAEVSRGLNSLTKEELSEYASNQEQIFQAEKVFKTDDPDSVKKLAKKQIEELQQKNYDLFTAGAQRALETEIETVSQVIKPEDIDVVENVEEFKTKYPKIDPKADAFIQEDGKIVINKERAAEVGAVKAGSHELLHKILRSELSNETAAQKLIEDFKSTLTDKELRIVQKRIDDNYRYKRDAEGNIISENALKDYNEEYLTAFSDAIGKGEIKFEEDIFTKIGNFISNIFKPKGYKKLNFTTGQNVYDFIKDYQKNIAKGKVIVEPKDVEGIIRESRSEEASNKVQEIYEEKGINGALEIIEQFKPITNKIVEQRKNAPGFDRQLLTDEIETGAGGILDLIQAYDPASNVPLAAYINKFLPVRAITASRRILEEEFAGDITEAPQVAAEAAPEAEVEAAPTKAKKQVKKETLSAENQQALEDVIADLELTEDELTFKTLPNAAIKVFAKQIGIPAKKFAGASNFTQGELGAVINFIEENIDIIRQALPQAAVLEGAPVSEDLIGTATGVPNNLLKDPNLYTRKERTTKKAGLVPYEKNKGIDNSSILKAIGIIEGKRTAGPRDKQAQTAKGLINVLAKFATNQEVRQQKDLTPQQKTDIETGKGSRLLYSFNTKGDGTWVPDLTNPLTGNKFYNFNVANQTFRISLFENDDFDYEILELTEGIKDDAFVNDSKSMAMAFFDELGSAEITGKVGAKDSIKVFSIVANSVLDIIKQDNLNSITFTGKEPSRRRLYESMVQKFQKELGWESYNFELEGETVFVVYNPKIFKSEETAPSDAKESRILFSKSKSDQPLKDIHKLELYDLNTNKGQAQYLKDIENILWPIFGDALKAGQLYGLGAGQNNKLFTKKVQALIKRLKKEKPLRTFSVNTAMNKPTQVQEYGKYGNDYNGLLKLKETGELDELNKKNFTLWKEFWEKTNTLIENNPKAVIPVLQLLQSATNDTTHINRRGAPLIAVDKNFTKTGKLEHAVPNVIAYMGLLDSILDPNLNFKTEFNFIKDNYKLIALSEENNKILDKVFRDKMPENWKNWYDRYFNPELAKLGGINPVDIQSLISDKNLSVELDVNIDGSKLSKADKEAQINLSKSIKKATTKNNKELPKKFQLPKGSTNEQVLDKMQELDNEANEARIKYSKSQNLDEAFNDIIEAKTGIETYKRFSPAKAAVRGASKGKFNFFIPPSAEDFTGLLYKTLAKGKLGDRQMQWYKDNLLDPYARAMNDVSSARVAMFEDYKQLKKDLKVIPKDLKKKSVDEYTREQAVRVYIWNEQGNKIPGLFKTDQKQLVDYVNNDPELKLFADQLVDIQKNDDYSAPKDGWLTGSITTDLLENVNSIKRKKYLEQWQNNVDEIFSEVNMNKLEAAFGKPYRKALENILTRMKTGRNKPFRSDTLAGRVTDWLNNSVGAIMFFNTRSAVLQTISSINFVNWSDNNIYQAGKAFANQPQYWKDFKFLFNSDFLKERRGGLRFNVSESEIADMAKKGGARGVISKILQAGFLPTQAADSFAIASGGATFYRNRIKSYIKEGLTEAEAQEKAFLDFREIAEESQQSSRPDRISAQQAGPLGRTILAFANTPAQYARLTKKAASDLVNGRGDAKTNISKLLYYGAVQNLIFNTLQQAAFAIAFGDDDEDEKKKEEKYISVANGMADGLLRGIGVGGAVIATLKNALVKIIKESEKKRPDYAETAVIQLLGISPPIQSKAQKIRSALKSYEWNKDEMKEKGFSLDNPAYLAGANVISASTNVPLDRIIKKVDNVRAATRDDISKLERMMLLAGWSDWQLGIQPERKPKKKKKTRSSRRGAGRSNNRSSNRR